MTPASILIFLTGFLSSALLSGIETGSYTLNRIRLRRRVREKQRAALQLERLLDHPHRFIFTVLIGNNIAIFIVSQEMTACYLSAGLEGSRLLLGFIPWGPETAAALTLMFPLFLLAEMVPKNLFRKNADKLMYRFAAPMHLLAVLLAPLTWPLHRLYAALTRGFETRPGRLIISPEALKEHLSSGRITTHQAQMVEAVTSMHSVPVRTLMTPFRKAPVLPVGATVADFRRLAAERAATTSALLVQHNRVVGLVPLVSIVTRKMADADPLQPVAETALEVPAGGNLKSAFYRLRHDPHHSAAVVDARRHPVGFIRLEDIARYIAGQPPSVPSLPRHPYD